VIAREWRVPQPAPDRNDRVIAFLDELVRDSGEWSPPLRSREDAYLNGAAAGHVHG